MTTLYSDYSGDYAEFDRPARGTLMGHIRTALFVGMLTLVVTIAMAVFSNRPPEPGATMTADAGTDYIAAGAEPATIDALTVP